MIYEIVYVKNGLTYHFNKKNPKEGKMAQNKTNHTHKHPSSLLIQIFLIFTGFLFGINCFYFYASTLTKKNTEVIQVSEEKEPALISATENPIKVSIIVPVYNTAPYLERCLDSAINQTLKDIEIICINDASTDNSLEILNKYAKKDKRIKVVDLKRNRGLSNARNVGISVASGEFIGFLDSDDFIDLGWYENLYNQSKDYDFIRGVRLIDGRYLPGKPYNRLVASIVRKSFVMDQKIYFKDEPNEDVPYAQKMMKLGARRNDTKDNGQYYHYEKREGSLTNPKTENIQVKATPQSDDKHYKDKLNVVFAIDNNYVYYAKLVINSIMKSNASNSKYAFWFLEANISEENKKDIEKYVKDIGQDIVFLTIGPEYMERWIKMYGKKEKAISMARILIPDLLPKSVKKALYLDTDLLVVEDLKNLFDEDLKDSYVGMAKDKIWEKGDYNAGVILFNIKKMRDDQMVSRILSFLNDHPDEFSCDLKELWLKTDSCYRYKDQDLLNITLKGYIKTIDQRWNNINPKGKIKKPNGIYHFAGGKHRKPWNKQDTDAQKLWIKNQRDFSLRTDKNIEWKKKEADKGTLRSGSLFDLKDEYRDKVHFYNLDETIDMLINKEMSLARFGNGELDLINGGEEKFQKFSPKLQKRLKEVLSSSDPKIGIGLPINAYTKNKNDFWIRHEKKFTKTLSLYINEKQTYFPSEITTKDIQSEWGFNKIRQVWDGRNVHLIHGKGIFDGFKYDIFDNAKSVTHQIAPSHDAFDEYDKILTEALKVDKNKLVIIVLGPTATVLAYDLAKRGYRALDLGHIAKSYEFYKTGKRGAFYLPDGTKEDSLDQEKKEKR